MLGFLFTSGEQVECYQELIKVLQFPDVAVCICTQTSLSFVSNLLQQVPSSVTKDLVLSF